MIPRGVDRPVLLGASAVGAALLAGCVAFAEDAPRLAAVRLALVPLAAAAAIVLDEPAADAVDAVPSTRRRRTAARAAAALLPFAVWGGGVLALELRNEGTHAAALLLEGGGVLCLAVAVAAVLRLTGRTAPGEIAASLLGAAILGVLAFHPPPRSAPIFPTHSGWATSSALWTAVAITAVAIVIAASRDPYRRQVLRGPGHFGVSRRP